MVAVGSGIAWGVGVLVGRGTWLGVGADGADVRRSGVGESAPLGVATGSFASAQQPPEVTNAKPVTSTAPSSAMARGERVVVFVSLSPPVPV
jgi:hypothetical protein